MNSSMTSVKVIEDLMQSSSAAGMDARAQYFFRESLYSLVRLAKAEQMLEIKSSVAKLTEVNAKVIDELNAEESIRPTYISIQQHFEFQNPNAD
jgi:hypothetical protein